jgi:hypothetical protein
VASWSHSKGSTVIHARCPSHGSMVVQTVGRVWVWRCHDCIAEAHAAIRRLRFRSL